MYTNTIKKRILEEANYLVDNKSTIRQTAKHFHISKSTVHKDVTQRLKSIKNRSDLFKKVRAVLDINTSERHIRGGESTRRKYSVK